MIYMMVSPICYEETNRSQQRLSIRQIKEVIRRHRQDRNHQHIAQIGGIYPPPPPRSVNIGRNVPWERIPRGVGPQPLPT